MTAFAAALVYAGLTSLCYTTERHRHAGTGAPPRVALAMTGSFCLVLAFDVCAAIWGWAVAPIAWLGLLTATGLGVALLLAYSRRGTTVLALLAPFAALGWEHLA